MADVINFPGTEEPERLIWTCAERGCQHFELFSDYSTECALCGNVGTDDVGQWQEHLPELVKAENPITPRHKTDHGSAAFAQRSIVNQIDDEACLLVVAWPGGKIRAWSGLDRQSPPKQQKWLLRILRGAARLILGRKDDTGPMPDE